MGDFNIGINTAGIEVDKLDEFCNLFDLTSIIKTETCSTKNQKITRLVFDVKTCLFKKPQPLKLELVTIINLFRHF